MKKCKVYIELATGSTLTAFGLVGTKPKVWLFRKLYEVEVNGKVKND